MIPYLLAVAGGYLIGNAFKDNMQTFASGGIVDPKILYQKLNKAEMNFSKDDGAEYYQIQKEISENRKLYFKKLGEAEMNFSKDDGAEYSRLMAMRDSFADGGMMADGGWISYSGTLFNPKDVKEHKTKEEAEKRAKSMTGERGVISKHLFELQNKYADGGMMAKGGEVKYGRLGYTVYQDGKAIESFKTEEQAKRFAKDLEKGMSYAYKKLPKKN